MGIPADKWERKETTGPFPMVRVRYDVWAANKESLDFWTSTRKCTVWDPFIIMPDEETFLAFKMDANYGRLLAEEWTDPRKAG